MTTSVRQRFDLGGGKGTIVLYDADDMPGYREGNLVCLGPTGTVMWTAPLPQNTGPDSFVDVKLSAAGVIVATSWSGYALTIEVETGNLLGQTFVK